jgi:hypothetical protein
VAVVLRTDPQGRADGPGVPGSARTDKASVVVAAIDTQGKVVGTVTQSAEVPWAPDGSGPVPYELLSRMELKPGRYEIRAASDLATGERSSVYGFVEVPPFREERVSLSGVVLEALPSGMGGPADAFATGPFASTPLPVVPTARRSFRTTDRVTAFVRVYRSPDENAIALANAQVVDAHGRIVYEEIGDASASDYRVDLPMERLAPGEYLLQITASAGESQASRSVRFSVQ